MNEEKLLGAIIKPRELVKQLRKRNPSIDAEWGFSSCPPNETSECLFWEFAREIPSIKQWVRKLRSACADKSFDGFYQAYCLETLGMWDLNKVPRIFAGRFYFAPEWPDGAYLSVGMKERRRRMTHQQDANIRRGCKGYGLAADVVIRKRIKPNVSSAIFNYS